MYIELGVHTRYKMMAIHREAKVFLIVLHLIDDLQHNRYLVTFR